MLVPKGLSSLATRSQSMHAGFQIQEKSNPLESLLICFLALLTPLSNNFKVLCLADKTAALMANEETGKENYLHTFRGVGS